MLGRRRDTVRRLAARHVLSGVSAEDGCELAPTLTNNAPRLFPADITTPVTFTATDAGSLTDTCRANVRVADTTNPAINCPANVKGGLSGGKVARLSEPHTWA